MTVLNPRPEHRAEGVDDRADRRDEDGMSLPSMKVDGHHQESDDLPVGKPETIVNRAELNTTEPDQAMVDTSLSQAEREELNACEMTIETGKAAFVSVATALLRIRDGRLYRVEYSTFQAYCRERWGFSRQRGHQLLQAAGVAVNLSTLVDTAQPLTERHARELASLELEEQRIIYRLAKATAPSGTITASHLKSLVAVASDVINLGGVDDGTGEQVAWDTLSPSRKAALLQIAVDEESFERNQRHRLHLTRLVASSVCAEGVAPQVILDAAREVFGDPIDLDPVSSDRANQTVCATHYFTPDDGLQHDWPGRIFLHPPQQLAGAFITHLLEQHAKGIVTAAIVVLTGIVTDTSWFRSLLTSWPICFVDRVDGPGPAGTVPTPPRGTVIVYVGPEPHRFAQIFDPALGVVLRRWPPAGGDA
jgi:hypothetical protein